MPRNLFSEKVAKKSSASNEAIKGRSKGLIFAATYKLELSSNVDVDSGMVILSSVNDQ